MYLSLWTTCTIYLYSLPLGVSVKRRQISITTMNRMLVINKHKLIDWESLLAMLECQNSELELKLWLRKTISEIKLNWLTIFQCNCISRYLVYYLRLFGRTGNSSLTTCSKLKIRNKYSFRLDWIWTQLVIR